MYAETFRMIRSPEGGSPFRISRGQEIISARRISCIICRTTRSRSLPSRIRSSAAVIQSQIRIRIGETIRNLLRMPNRRRRVSRNRLRKAAVNLPRSRQITSRLRSKPITSRRPVPNHPRIPAVRITLRGSRAENNKTKADETVGFLAERKADIRIPAGFRIISVSWLINLITEFRRHRCLPAVS